MSIDWRKEPNAVGALVTKPCNVHHPKTVFAAEFFIFGCMLKGTDCNGNAFSAVDDCWEWVHRPSAQWTGTGLPPVGTVCEFKANILGWVQATITAVTELSIVFTRPSYQNGRPLVEERLPHKAIERFRQIRTPEQIAAEERKSALDEMVFGACGCEPDGGNTNTYIVCGLLYDAGYRKVTP